MARKWRKKGKEGRGNRKLKMERGREIKVQRDICKRDGKGDEKTDMERLRDRKLRDEDMEIQRQEMI